MCAVLHKKLSAFTIRLRQAAAGLSRKYLLHFLVVGVVRLFATPYWLALLLAAHVCMHRPD